MFEQKAAVNISDDKSLLQIDIIHDYLSNQSYWAKGIPKDLIIKSIENSLCIGAYVNSQQVGFCRVISDYATFGNLVDVFVIEQYQRRGIAKQLMSAVIEHPLLQGLRRITLMTMDAHKLYAKYGFKQLAKPEVFMELHQPNIYTR
ncbi:GNAT family N-acetyltransferase [Aliikangiella coralliicola]|uniref:GNAT family N-acetyltransferase n=1 Tax=Aliikangiella coralliicola TaxID=2592383 RepID=A0A545UH12_9GAMM|nr:GNAT family N-acetyltransferase [Aliikangiella coralliicola]TQV88756.1 GNAT family N-acetyltransferase [Aliikangiella coralliicola]